MIVGLSARVPSAVARQGSNCSAQKWQEAAEDGCWGHIADLILKAVFPESGALSGVAWPGLVEC